MDVRDNFNLRHSYLIEQGLIEGEGILGRFLEGFCKAAGNTVNNLGSLGRHFIA